MKGFFKYYSLMIIIVINSTTSFSVNPDFETIRKRVVVEMLGSNVNDAHIQTLISSIQDKGTWPGIEYVNIFPMYDWQKIPGTTVLQKSALPSEDEIQKEGLTSFVGGVTDGLYGAAVFDFRSPNDLIKAKKAWFFFDREYVCLGTGIGAGANLPIATTLNQCLLKGDVVVWSDSKKNVLQKGDHELTNVKWILHDSVAYLFPEPVKVNLSNQSATGSWYKINHQSDSPKEEISKEVFKLWIDHGKRPGNGRYQYIVVPSVTENEIKFYSGNKSIEILSNTSKLQAVRNSELGIIEAVFHSAGEIISGKFEAGGKGYRIAWDSLKGLSEISIDLPEGVYEGKSVTIEL